MSSNKVQSKRSKKTNNKTKKSSLYHTLLFTLLYGIGMMYIYGMSVVYFPDPISLGSGQYIDLSIGILFFGLMIYGIILGFLLKKNKNKI